MAASGWVSVMVMVFGAAPSTEYVTVAGAELPDPVVLIVQDGLLVGALTAQDPLAWSGHEIVGAAGVPVATMTVVHPDHPEFEPPLE